MAPRKEKSEKTPADQGSAMIVDYLKKQKQRTFQQIYTTKSPRVRADASLTGAGVKWLKPREAYAVKALKELHEQQVVAGKAAGKQIVYHAVQDPEDAASMEDLAAMDKEIVALRDAIATAKANEKLLNANLVTLNATLSTEDLRAGVVALELDKQEILARLGPLRSGSIKPVSMEEKEAVDKLWNEWSRKARMRKQICLEVWAHCTENLQGEQTTGELWDELGLEADE